MTRTLLVAGTASHVGKSTVAAGLCRSLADRGVSVAPYKAQNMSNNARVVVRHGADESGERSGGVDDDDRSGRVDQDDWNGRSDRDGPRWGEIGVSQFVQARAARIEPTTDCNPVLLKPHGDGESQLVVQGRAVGTMPAGAYYEDHWERAREAAESSYRRLARTHEVVIAEGAGSIAEINLRDRDLANVEIVRFAERLARERGADDPPIDILLLVDIERGGAFASLYGTLELLPDDLREYVTGAVITKFRGDPSLLDPGIEEIESRTGVPVLGVIPYDDPGLPEEDSVGIPDRATGGIAGDDDGVSPDRSVTIAVPRLPYLSNATDLEALADVPGVRVAYVPLDGVGGPLDGSGGSSGNGGDEEAERAEAPSDCDEDQLANAHAVVIPGTKNTVDDLLALRESGLADAIRSFSGPVVGICGGYQMLGERITNADIEGTGDREEVAGLGLLPVETTFEREKRLERTTVAVGGESESEDEDERCGPISGATGTASGYEIHAGRTRALESIDRPLGPDSAVRGNVLGTYLHGCFDADGLRTAFLENVYEYAGRSRPTLENSETRRGEAAYDRARRLVEEYVDLAPLGAPLAPE